jgi:4-amino-4-deoxy-L-arabinose transferase-like glycosyltransferase
MYISKKIYFLLFFLLGIIYFLGFLFPLMDLDATEYAMVALRMVKRHDFISIISRSVISFKEYDFLDKPHLSFWLEALSYQIFGFKDWAYRIPSVLFTLLGGFSTYQLGRKLYTLETGFISALIFFCAQAIILENHDARTDAILGGAVIFGVWQLYLYLDEKKWLNLFLGVLGLVLGMATKGMISVIVSGAAIFFYLLYSRNWKVLSDFKWLLAVPLFFLMLSPVLYAYYVQFDLHPEKLIKGAYNVSGIKFLLWSQSFERYAGEGEYVQYPEFSFFFHTYLWAFLPWSVLSYISVFYRGWEWIKIRFQKIDSMEFMTWGTSVSLFLLLSGMQYKMPHYINILFPFLSILLASFILRLSNQDMEKTILLNSTLNSKNHTNASKLNHKKWNNALIWIQGVINLILLILVIVLNFYAFPITSLILGILFLVVTLSAFYFFLKAENSVFRLVVPTSLVAIAVNLLINGNFYPKLLAYQSGNTLARYIEEKEINRENIYYFNTISRAFDFYTQKSIPEIDTSQLRKLVDAGKRIYIYIQDSQIPDLKRLKVSYTLEKQVPNFRVTKLNIQFLNPVTRESSLQKTDLIRIN